MNTKQATKWMSSDWFYVLVSLLTLETFVVAQSVYDILASNQAFLAVRQVTNQRLLEIILVFNLLPVLVLFLLWALCRRLHTGLSRAFLSVVYFVLFFAFFLQAHNAYLSGWQPFPQSYLLWIVPSALLVFVSLRFEKPFRSFVLALSPVVLIFPLLFLNRTWTTPKALLPEGSLAVQKEVSQTGKKNLPPIFLLVFDELTTHALLDKDGQIDGTRFPNFKKLASESYWFRNATANAEYTNRSIPVILTGNFPIGKDPSYRAYPNNLLNFLYPHYEIYVHELMTHFCVQQFFHCPDTSDSGVLTDIFYLYAARVLPKSVNVELPNLTQTWGTFRSVQEEMRERIKRFRDFSVSLDSSSEDNIFHFFHHMLPHSPYLLTSEGKIYKIKPALLTEDLKGRKSLVRSLRDRYLMQVAFVDKEVGLFIERLNQLGLYDKALIILTSDHGISWKPEHPGRWLSKETADMILSVPLFIKVPFQEEGTVSDRDVQHIDIAPTVADLLGQQLPWSHVGRSVFSSDENTRQKIAYDETGTRYSFPQDFGLSRTSLRFDIEGSSLIGQAIDTFHVNRHASTSGLLDSLYRIENGDGTFPLYYVDGWAVSLQTETVPDQIAVAANGRIVAVSPPCCERPNIAKLYNNQSFLRSGWSMFFSGRQIPEEVTKITAYVVLDSDRRELAILNRPRSIPAEELSSLIGMRTEDFNIQQYETVVGFLDTVSDSEFHRDTDDKSELSSLALGGLPIYVYGWAALLDESSVPDQIAVAVNGKIAAVTSPCCDRADVAEAYKNPSFLRSGWEATISSQELKDGKNILTAYVVLDANTKKLAILKSIENTIQVIHK